MYGVASAAEQAGVSCLKAKSKRIRSDIGTGFIDNPHNAQRHDLLSDQQSAFIGLHLGDCPDGIFQVRHLSESFCHAFDPVNRQSQTVHQCLRHPALHGCFHVFYILRKNVILVCHKLVCRFPEQLVFVIHRRLRQNDRRFFCLSS